VQTFEVLHLHRIGKCRGRLLVSRSGIAFLPSDKESDDAVTLRYDEFMQSVNTKELTIKGPKRVYRFAPVVGTSSSTDAQVTRIARAIARARMK
jgi:hypothetical protein